MKYYALIVFPNKNFEYTSDSRYWQTGSLGGAMVALKIPSSPGPPFTNMV